MISEKLLHHQVRTNVSRNTPHEYIYTCTELYSIAVIKLPFNNIYKQGETDQGIK